MNSFYSIIIPVHNEESIISELARHLKPYYLSGHEVIIVDDGSLDNSKIILKRFNFIKTIRLEKNLGKGKAIQKGLAVATNSKIILFDGDMEIHPNQINHLMILDKDKNINCVFGKRFKKIKPLKSKWDFGNYFFTYIFDFIHRSKVGDSLCCAKAFFREDINPLELKSKKFDVDVELASILIKKNKDVKSILVEYQRRTKDQGKKLRVYDGLSILRRIITFK